MFGPIGSVCVCVTGWTPPNWIINISGRATPTCCFSYEREGEGERGREVEGERGVEREGEREREDREVERGREVERYRGRGRERRVVEEENPLISTA